MNIIALSGYSNVGKTTVAKIVQWLLTPDLQDNFTIEEYIDSEYQNGYTFKDFKWQIHSFADNVNEAYRYITGVDFHSLDRNAKEKERPYFVEFAESTKKALGKNCWVNSLFKNYNPLIDNLNWIIPDVRKKVEYDYLRNIPNTKIIRINKPCEECGIYSRHLPDCSIGEKYDNDSELNNVKFDYIILNDNTIIHLIESVKLILKEWQLI